MAYDSHNSDNYFAMPCQVSIQRELYCYAVNTIANGAVTFNIQ